MSADLKPAKKALRERVIALRDALPEPDRAARSEAIVRTLLASSDYRAAHVITAYASFGSELDTSVFLLQALADGKQLLLPRIDKAKGCLELRRVIDLQADLVGGVWGIREPALHCLQVDPGLAEFVLVPGVAFTRRGERLGYGGGYYDRLLTEVAPLTRRVAGAFSIQVVEALPLDRRDQPVHAVVTEKETLTD